MTWSDLGNRMQTVALRWFPLERHGEGNGPENFRVTQIEETLDVYTRVYPLGAVVWPHFRSLFASNYRELVDALAARGLYLFDIWDYCPSGPDDAPNWSEYRVPAEMERYLEERLGHRFLGWDNGEQDGRFVGGYAKVICPAPTSRAEAHEAFQAYMDRLAGDLQHRLVALNSLTLTHYLARRPDHRMLGLETGQGLPSVPMWFAFLRGACKQHGLLWFGNASCWNRWGWHDADAADDTPEPGHRSGPNIGTSLDLLRRLWYLEVMYGSCMMSFEMGHLSRSRTTEVMVDGQPRTVPALTSIGELQVEGTRWCERHPQRGEPYMPLALLWDHEAGWLPPRHLYTADTFMVWGSMPYAAGDHQIDLVLRALFPDYENGSFFHDETGFVTATPCGDIADVLLSDVPAAVLRRYRFVLVLGETRVGGELLERLRAFVNGGGQVAAFANQCDEEALAFFGARRDGAPLHLNHAVVGANPGSWREPAYTAEALRLVEGEVVARTGAAQGSHPLAVRRLLPGGGQTLLFAAHHGISHPLCAVEGIESREDLRLGSPHQLLDHVRALLLPALRALNVLHVVGPPVQYLTNVTDDPRRVLLTLTNPTSQPWEGAARFHGAGMGAARVWLPEGRPDPRIDGPWARLELAPRGVAVYELIADEPVVEFMTDGRGES